jgi:hypothetical protein
MAGSLYRFGPTVLRSPVPVPELLAVVDEQPDLFIDEPQTRDLPTGELPTGELPTRKMREKVDWYHHRTTPEGEVRLSLGRTARGFVMRFKGFPSFHISEDGARIECRLSSCALRHLLLNQVLPHALGLRGYLTLHASVVRTEHGAIAFMGKSGSGKSTLVAALLAEARTNQGRNGVRLISDDCLIMSFEGNRASTFPSYPCLRLRSGSASLKSSDRIARGPADLPFEPRPVPFHRLYILDPLEKGPAGSTPVSPRQAFVEASQSAFQLLTSEPRGVSQTFHRIADLALSNVYRLHVPRDLSALPEIAQALLDRRL